MEHRRWCADRWLEGWRHGLHRDDARRIHPDLCDWEALPPEETRIDRDMMAGICRALASTGKGVFR
jgi:hypothetical protein